ncbi:putative zinc finger protein [Orchesella cincta]|uniref:Putative zinc finger protein n=1 Tax=Orchesella cincta TaxID=48709 RepID=A0A1D2MTB3_ORCCI|nr:putative zinc finger protein [Orchesella cincta]
MAFKPEQFVVKVEPPQSEDEWEGQNQDEDSLLTSADSESFGGGTVIKIEVEPTTYSSSDAEENCDDDDGSRSPQEENSDDDGDWKPEKKPDIRKSKAGRPKKKSISQESKKYGRGTSNKGLTLEELKAKRALQARQRRQRKKLEMTEEEQERKVEERKYAKATSNKGLTPEEIRAKKRDMQRKRRERIRAQLTEEELEELKRKEREKKRLSRARFKLEEEGGEVESERRTRPKGSFAESASEDDFVKKEGKDDDDDYEPHEDSEETPRKSRKDMSRAELRKKWREEALARRRRKRAEMTPEQREEVLRKERERKRELRGSSSGSGRGIKKEGGLSSDAQERRRREAEARRLKRLAMTPEQKEEAKQADKIRRMMRHAALTEEEKAERKMKAYMQVTAKLSTLSKEELEEIKKKKAERARLRRQKMEKSERRVLYERSKRWRQNLQGEKLERAKEQLKQAYYRKMERAKNDPELMAKIKREWKQGYERQKDPTRKKRLKPGETEEMRLERRREKKRQDMKKFNLKRRLERQRLLESGVPLEEIRTREETPEQRERRCLRNRMYRAKQTLRDQLIRQGVSQAVIQERLAELVANWVPSRAEFRPYKPKALKPLEPEDLKILAEGPKPKRKSTESAFSTPSKAACITQPDTKPLTNLTPFKTPSTSTVHPVPAPTSYSSSSSGAHDLSYQHHQPSNTLSNYQSHFLNYAPSTSAPTPSTSSAYHQNHTPFFSAIDYEAQSYCSSSQDDCSAASIPPHHLLNHLLLQFSGNLTATSVSIAHPSPSLSPTSASVLAKPKSNRGRPRKSRAKPKPPPGVPVPQIFRGGKHANTVRDQMCQICGYRYSKFYIADHMLCTHNPNYQNGKCVLCNAEFSSGRKFYYDHWIRVHKVKEIETNPDGSPKEMYMCDECGAGPFYKKGTFYTHKHYTHGNYETDVPCEHCKKIFKTARSLYTHIRRYHKDVKKSVAFWNCLKCEEAFSAQTDLKEHVKTKHPDSYFTCPDCDVFKYTEANMKFHWYKCAKRDKSKEVKEKGKKEDEIPSIEKIQVPCEICEIKVQLSSLTRHYKDIHGIIEELFKCLKCPKTFKRREFWVAHLEMLHSLDIDDIRDEIYKYNVSDRSALEIKNKEGGHKGLPGHLWAGGEWLKKKKKTGGKRGRPPGRGRVTGRGGKRTTTRRRIHSSDEEEDEEKFNLDSESDPEFVLEEPKISTSRRGRRKGRAVRFSGEDIETEKRLVISISPLTEEEIRRFVGKKAEEPSCDDDNAGKEIEIEDSASCEAPKVKVEVADNEVADAVSPLALDFELGESVEESLPIPDFFME